jgi:hypothetical protein
VLEYKGLVVAVALEHEGSVAALEHKHLAAQLFDIVGLVHHHRSFESNGHRPSVHQTKPDTDPKHNPKAFGDGREHGSGGDAAHGGSGSDRS